MKREKRKRRQYPKEMADSSKSTELEEPVIGAKSKPGEEEKKKRKQGKKFGREKFNETEGSKPQERGEEEGKTQTVAIEQTSLEISGESKSQDGKKMPAEGQEREETNKEDIVKKDAPQDHKSIQESSEEKTVAKSDLATEQDGAESTKKSKRPHLSFLHPKRHSKTKVPSGEGKAVEDMADKDESTEVEAKKSAENDDETSEQQEEIIDGAKIEPDTADIQNKEATKSPEGIQEKPPSKGNKGKKFKQLASFGRSKKKPDVTVKHEDNELPDSETLIMTESSGPEDSQNIESASTEVASLEKSDSANEDIDAGEEKDEKDEKDETQDTGKAKPFGSFLGLRRSKHAKKKKSLKSEELEKNAEIVQAETSASKTDDVTVVEGVLLEEKTVEENTFEIVDSHAEEPTGSAETDKEEVDSSEKKAEQEATTAEGQEREETNKEDIVKKDAPQDHKSIQESSEEKTVAKSDLATEQDGAESTKKSKRPHLSFLHPKRHSKTKVPSGEGKAVEDMADKDESTEVEAKKSAENDDETSEQQEEIIDGAKIEPDTADIQNKEATKSPEGIQEKPPSKGNKGKKFKQLASFGRSKKKPDVTVKHEDNELPDSETLIMTESSGPEDSQNIESASTEVASLEKSDSANEDIDAGEEKDEKDETQDTGKAKPFGSFLGLRRSKHAKKKKSLKSEELEQNAEIVQGETSASKTDDVTVVEGVLLEEKTVEENTVEIVDSQAEEPTGSAETDKEEVDSSEKKAEQEATTDEEMSSTSTKKDRESKLLRSFRKLKSPRSKSKKKAKENESDVITIEDGATKTEVEPGESPEPKPKRGFGKAGKRKRSDSKKTGRIRAEKRQREDQETKREGDDVDYEGEEEEAFAKSQDQQESAKATEEKDDKGLSKQKKKGSAHDGTKDLQVRFTGDKVGRMGEADEEPEDSEIGDASYESDLTMVSDITVVSSIYEVRREEPSQTGTKVEDTKKPTVTLQVPDSADKTEPKVEEQPRVVEVDEEIIIENEGDEKKEVQAGEKSSDPSANNPRAWIFVRHLEMNEDITRQLGDMFMVNALKRSMSCCTIM